MPRSFRRTLARIGRWPRIAAAVACLLLAGVSALDSSHRDARAAPAHLPTRPVTVAARTLPAGHVLTRRDLAVAHVPANARPDGTFPAVAPLVGRRLAGAVTAREPLTRTRFVGTDLAAGLGSGRVAVPVVVAADVAGLVHAGDRVDLLAVAAPDAAGAAPDPKDVSGDARAKHGAGPQTVVAGARVLAVLGGQGDDSTEGADGTELVVATTREVAVQIAALRVTRMFTAVVAAP